MTAHRRIAATCIAVSALASSSLAAPDTSLAKTKLLQCVAREAKADDFSGVISVTWRGVELVYAQGKMGGRGSRKMSPDAQFNIGSAGKMWTAVSVAQLADGKKIGLDDPIGRYVNGLTPEAATVTIRQLLTHSGGLGNFFTPDNMEAFKRATSLAELKPLVTGAKPAFTPGSRSEYSNTGFLLLGLMIESVSGKSFGDYLQQNVFAPAGMTHSSLSPGRPDIRAIGMTNFPELPPESVPPPGPPPPRALSGPPPSGPNGQVLPPPGPLRPAEEAAIMGTSAGGGFSTPLDIQRFFAAFLAGKLTSPELRDELTSRQIEILPAKGPLPAVYYGLGFTVADYKGRGWTGHNGGLPGGNIATSAFAKDQITAVIMTNRDPPRADLMMRKVYQMLFDDTRCS
jgi:D-alanyl-D-alanine carboxypeptidase